MIRTILVLTFSVPLAATALADGPIDGTVYGRVNVSVVDVDSGADDQWELQSNASRLGFKGKSQLADELYAIYKLEYEVDVDGDGDIFRQRNIIAGLSGSLGTLWGGRHDTATKSAQNKIDLFSDLPGDMKFAFEGENRVSNILAYTTPTFHGVSLMVANVFAEGEDFDQDGEPDDNLGDGITASLNYKADNLYLAVAVDKDLDKQDLLRVVGQWNHDDLQLGFMYQQNESNLDADILDESGYFLSVAYSLGKLRLKGQYGTVEDDADNDEYDTWSIGADYRIVKNSKLYAFYTRNTETPGASGAENLVDKYLGVGLEHNF